MALQKENGPDFLFLSFSQQHSLPSEYTKKRNQPVLIFFFIWWYNLQSESCCGEVFCLFWFGFLVYG